MTTPTAGAAGGLAADGSGKITHEPVLAAALQITGFRVQVPLGHC